MKSLATLTDSIEHVYVLINAWTFSAGNASLAFVKEHDGKKVTMIDEAAGDRVRIWAEGSSFELPNSKIRVSYATGLHDYSKSCRGESGRFWVMYFFPMLVQSFAPDVPVPYTFDDYLTLRDPMLQKGVGVSEFACVQRVEIARAKQGSESTFDTSQERSAMSLRKSRL